MKSIPVGDVIVDEAVYPRKTFDRDTVSRYQQSIDILPPIVINQNNILVDGNHRLMAYKIEQRETIPVIVEDIPDDQVLWEATKRNATHGLQLSGTDKKHLGREFYKQNKTADEIANVLSVDHSTVTRWTKDIKNERDKERDNIVWELWLGNKTQNEIARDCGYSDKSGVNKVLVKLKKLHMQNIQPPNSIQDFNIWRFTDNDSQFGMKYPGRIPGQIVENLLYYFTTPFQTVVDPMGGGGTTVDVCKAMNRRYRVYDIKPVRGDIHQHDITIGFPAECKGCDFIFMDPPYWMQKKGDYSKDETNLANLTLEEFYQTMDDIFISAEKVLKSGGYLAFIIGITKKDGVKYFHGHELAILAQKYFSIVEWIEVPYTTQQCTGANIARAREQKQMLTLKRDLVVLRKQ